ncbi:MAG: stage III sporulation protein AF [Bacillus sp. (in: Bacteria)]|nr:stage III sporulation protein AF [Bacillus sp. (in: firmicutes)]
MSVITAWITNIILLILFATILELLLPNSKMQRYVKLVVGLMLLMVMLQPLLSIFQTDTDEWLQDITSWTDVDNEKNSSLLESKKMDIEMDNLAYISEQVAVQLKNKATKQLEERFEVVPLDVVLEFNSLQHEQTLDNLSSVYVLLQPVDAMEHDNSIKVVEIDPVKIMQELPKEEDMTTPTETSEISSFLAALWEVPESIVHVHMKGGED